MSSEIVNISVDTTADNGEKAGANRRIHGLQLIFFLGNFSPLFTPGDSGDWVRT